MLAQINYHSSTEVLIYYVGKVNAQFWFKPRLLNFLQTIFEHFLKMLQKLALYTALKLLYMLINLKLLPLLHHFM